MTSQSRKIRNYRKDIDGLRAIAVLLVVFFHLRVKAASAGFVGVDIFFVISGYLITSHIFQEIQIQQFSLKHFYLKRIRRILPALVVVLIFSSIAAYFLLLPKNLQNYTSSLLATICSVANFYFWRFIHIGYFSTDASKLPLLHTWSLGVEEQFYIVWPLLMLILTRNFRKKGLFSSVGFLTLVCFGAYYFFRSHSQFVFYSPLTRGFELLIGGWLALNDDKITLSRWQNHVLSLIGGGCILYGGCLLTPQNYPSLNVLFPVLGATTLLYTGRQDGIANKLLELKPLVFIGLISYSLYLWHWPVIAYLNYLGVALNLFVIIAVVAVSILLAFLSWYLVEQPFRFKYKFGFLKSLILLWFIPFVLAVSFSLAVNFIPHFGFNRIKKSAQQAIDNEYYGFISRSSGCHGRPRRSTKLGPVKECSVGDRSQKHVKVLITGDSHAMASSGMLNVFLKHAGLKGYIATQSSTPFLLVDMKEPKKLASNLKKRNPVIKHLIERNHYKYVVMGGDWDVPGYKLIKHLSLLETGLENTVRFVIKNHATPVIILDFPPLFNIPVNCGITRVSLQSCFNKQRLVEKRQGKTRQMIYSLKREYPKLILIDPSRVICQQNKCYSILNKTPLYFTGGLHSHLNFQGSTLVGQQYLQQYGNPFK